MVSTVPDIAINDGPGYREFDGETTKHALEPSVFNARRSRSNLMGFGSRTI
jgi:hypothetical protein